jgi:hypothetical protein
MNDAAAWASQKFDGLRLCGRLILLFAAILATAELEFFVTREEIRKATALSKKTLIREFRQLQALGLISRDSRQLGERTYWGAARYRAACFELALGSQQVGMEHAREGIGDDVPAC